MSVLSFYTGFKDFKVIDDATQREVKEVAWVDDVELEYARVLQPPRMDCHGSLETEVLKVSAVSVNYAAREIHVNHPALIQIQIGTLCAKPQQGACDECCNEGDCERVGQCLKYRCCFGEHCLP